MSGYFGIGIENTKSPVNIGTLWRSAYNLGASFIFVIGRRYKHQASDTVKSIRSIPLYEYLFFEDFYSNIPHGCELVGVEFPHSNARSLERAYHPDRAVYLLGAEDSGLSKKALEKCHRLIYIPSIMSLNVAVAGSIVMYDRQARKNDTRRSYEERVLPHRFCQ